MKRIVIALCLVLALVIPTMAQDNTSDSILDPSISTGEVTLKQGFIGIYGEQGIKKMTIAELYHTKKIDSWGKWNALYDGWSIDAGVGYNDLKEIEDAAVVLGRRLGVIADYFPIDFPFDKRIKITLYPIGLYFKDVRNKYDPKLAYAGSYFTGELKF